MGEQLTVRFKGADADENIRIEDLSSQLDAISRALTEINKIKQPKKGRVAEIKVVDLTHNSPASITLETTDSIFDDFLEFLDNLNLEKLESTLTRRALEAYQDIARGMRHMKEIAFSKGNRRVIVESRAVEYIELLLTREIASYGTMRGMLEFMNVHDGANTFRIYPIVGPSYVNCIFPEAIKETAKKSLGQYVEVSGRMIYPEGENWPVKIDVTRIEIMPDDSNLPTLEDLKGLTKTTDGLSTEDIIREARDEQW